MNEYIIQRVTEPDWSVIPTLSIDYPYLQTPKHIRAWAQICWSEDAFHVHLWAEVPEIRAVENGPVGVPCEDSCLEFFFQPMEDDSRYINIEFNINRCMYLGIGSCVEELIRMIPEDINDLFLPETRRTATGWELFYQIPFRFIRRLFPSFEATPGKTIRANCFTCADLTEPAYYLSWSPISGEPFTFHRSKSFGFMKLSNF